MTGNKKRKFGATLAISLGFLLLYAVIRNAPVEPCEVLHYGEYMNEDGAVENCGEEETAFFDMTKVRYPVEFGLVMGAYAHLVVFDEEGKGFAHLHPQNPFVGQQDPKNPDLRFSFFPADPGKYRLWAQLLIDGQERFVPFDLEVTGDA